MTRWWLIIALLLSVGLNLGILAAIAARRTGPPPGSQRPPKENLPNLPAGGDPLALLPRLADRLGLEGEDRRKFLDIQLDLFRETSRLRVQLGEIHREVRREMTRDEPDRQRVDKLLNESAQVYLALERSLATHVLSTRDLLDADQRRQYLALVGRLRVANPGPGLGGTPNQLGPGPRRPQSPDGDPRQQRIEQRRMRQRLWEERRREGFPGRRFPGRRGFGPREPVPP